MRFTEAEASLLLQQVMGSLATAEVTSFFLQRMEGWAVGHNFVLSSSRLIVDYLLTDELEVLLGVERAMLLYTATLPGFTAALCDAIMPPAANLLTGQEFLDRLRRSNLFLVKLDDLCPCQSGRKFKRCHGSSLLVYITSLAQSA